MTLLGMDVFAALESRRSVRAYLAKPVSEALIKRILAAASRSPSGTNMQPWRVYVVTGSAKDALVRDVMAMRLAEPHREQNRPPFGEYDYNPEPLFEPYGSRRRKLGWDLYSLHGVARGDRVASWEVSGRNFEFFGAPVGMIFTIDRKLQAGSWLDCGIFLQSLMLAARASGLDTCAQAAWRHYYDIIRKHLSVPDSEIIICGMSLGYADTSAVANRLRSEREPLSVSCSFLGDGLMAEADVQSAVP